MSNRIAGTSPGRVGVVSAEFVGLLYLVLLIALMPALIELARTGDRDGLITADFTVFWTAGHAAIAGHAGSVYDWPWFLEFATRLMGKPVSPGLVWRNPPTFLLIVLPTALLPYGWAWSLWMLATTASIIATVRLITSDWRFMLLVLLAPASVVCVVLGQNGFLTATLAALAMLWLDRRPVAAGLCLALLTYKPQFGVVLPLLLLLSQRWMTLIAASVGTLLLFVLTAVAFGVDVWSAFLASLSGSAANLSGATSGATYFYHSIQTLLYRAGAPAIVYWAAHAVVAVLAIAVALLYWLRRRPDEEELRVVATFAAMMLTTPFVFIYDQVLLGVAAAFLARAAHRSGGWLPGELPLVILGCLLPGLSFFMMAVFAGPLAWLIFLGLAVRRGIAVPRGVPSVAS